LQSNTNVKTVSRPPLWARNNARKLIDLIDGTLAYVSLIKIKSKPGQIILKRAAEALFQSYLREMQADGRVLITGERTFIAPCLGTLFISDGNEVERNVIFQEIKYIMRRSGADIQGIPLMNIPHHAFGRIFERDLRPPNDVANAFTSKDFLKTVLHLHAMCDSAGSTKSFAIRFLNGFLTGTVREYGDGTGSADTKVLDVRTFLHRKDKPDWVTSTRYTPYTLFEHSDRRTRKFASDELIDRINEIGKPILLGVPQVKYKVLPPEA
jgi:hypothetical protein